jgi:hypothetical protein
MDIDDRKEEYSKHPLPSIGEVDSVHSQISHPENLAEVNASQANHTNSFVISDDV